MNVLITGISGFVGRNLEMYLNKTNFKVKGISRTPRSSKEIKYCDLLKEVWDHAHAMIHLAGKAHDLKKTSVDQEYFEVNTELTKKLYNDFLESDCETFIYISSVKAAADEVEGHAHI